MDLLGPSSPVWEQPVRSGCPTSGAFGVSEKFRGRVGGPRRPQETTGGLQLLPSTEAVHHVLLHIFFFSLFVRLACVRIPERLSEKKASVESSWDSCSDVTCFGSVGSSETCSLLCCSLIPKSRAVMG